MDAALQKALSARVSILAQIACPAMHLHLGNRACSLFGSLPRPIPPLYTNLTTCILVRRLQPSRN